MVGLRAGLPRVISLSLRSMLMLRARAEYLVDYVVNSSASLARPIEEERSTSPADGLRFASGCEGLSVVTTTTKQLLLSFIDKEGRTIHLPSEPLQITAGRHPAGRSHKGLLPPYPSARAS